MNAELHMCNMEKDGGGGGGGEFEKIDFENIFQKVYDQTGEPYRMRCSFTWHLTLSWGDSTPTFIETVLK